MNKRRPGAYMKAAGITIKGTNIHEVVYGVIYGTSSMYTEVFILFESRKGPLPSARSETFENHYVEVVDKSEYDRIIDEWNTEEVVDG